jgi:hypothetical protein
VSNKYTSNPFVALLALEVSVIADVGNRREDVCQMTLLWSPQNRLEDFAMLLLSTAIALCRTLLERLNQIV